MQITKTYSKEQYISDVKTYTLSAVWKDILQYIRNHGETDLLKIAYLSELYELGLSIDDKQSKKESGVYYTPQDVASLMADYYIELLTEQSNICDVCTGTGNLILSVLEKLTKEQRQYYLENKRIYLYELDAVALSITLNKIGYLYGYDYIDYIQVYNGDFLIQDVTLPIHSVVISNPPYYKITSIIKEWNKTKLLLDCKEYYAVFMEKCIAQSDACVFITPYSFISGTKFIELRKQLSNTTTRIYAFDNVPGNIFNGKKYGIFNTNKVNSTRASISVIDTTEKKGVLTTALLRFATNERQKILQKGVLDTFLDNTYYQKNVNDTDMFYKCQPEFVTLFREWREKSTGYLKDIVSDEVTPFKLDMPTTCRYFTVASNKELQRDGKYTLYFNSVSERNYAYVLLNSSFTYWWWRLYDGAVLYSLSLLYNLPINFSEITLVQRKKITNICKSYFRNEHNNLIYKKNANKIQENIKFSYHQRCVLNDLICDLYGFKHIDFSSLHSSKLFSIAVDNLTDIID